MDALKKRLIELSGLPDNPSLWELVEAVRQIPYGRPIVRTPGGVLDEWKGTCSTKHALLAEVLADRPELDLRLFHRIYRVTPEAARERFGDKAASVVPLGGLTDVHTYARATIEGRDTVIDVTFPSNVVWDGRSDMPLACGDGRDIPASDDPWTQKSQLIVENCDLEAREPFIQALVSTE